MIKTYSESDYYGTLICLQWLNMIRICFLINQLLIVQRT